MRFFMIKIEVALLKMDTEAIIVAKAQKDSAKLIEWVYWMALDILLSLQWSIEYRYVYWDKKGNTLISRKRRMARILSKRYARCYAGIKPDEDKIFISPDAEDKALCLFHECMEILFSDWKDEYYVPGRWGLKKSGDPILNLEDATWGRLTKAQKSAIKAFLPQEP